MKAAPKPMLDAPGLVSLVTNVGIYEGAQKIVAELSAHSDGSIRLLMAKDIEALSPKGLMALVNFVKEGNFVWLGDESISGDKIAKLQENFDKIGEKLAFNWGGGPWGFGYSRGTGPYIDGNMEGNYANGVVMVIGAKAEPEQPLAQAPVRRVEDLVRKGPVSDSGEPAKESATKKLTLWERFLEGVEGISKFASG
jgi:hypothetical protein